MKTLIHSIRITSLLISMVLVSSGIVVADTPRLLDPLSQPKFTNPLPNPLAPGFIWMPTTVGGSHYEIGIFQTRQDLGLRDPSGNPLLTTVWGYGYTNDSASATYPGRTFVQERNQQITVDWSNKLVNASGLPLPHLLPIDSSLHWALMEYGDWRSLGVPVVTHLHGGHTESSSDGLPDAWFTPNFAQKGANWVKETYVYDNDQEAATIWYHDHALGITRLNVYAGLAGFYLLRDANEASLNLPTYPYEVPIVIQDRMFTEEGGLFYPSSPEMEHQPEPSVLPEFFGNVILVNGKAWPVLDVEPRKYRLRLLNGSDSRFYTLVLSSGQQFVQIGTDLGLLYSPVTLDHLTLGPGERADVIVDFAGLAGRTVIMKNRARAPYPKGETPDPRTVGQIMAFRVQTASTVPDTPLPSVLRSSPIAPLEPTASARKLLLFEGEDEFGRLQPALGTVAEGAKTWDDPITEDPMLDDVEMWEFYNSTEDAHPIHLHLVSFQIVNRQKFVAQQDATTGALSNIQLLGKSKPPSVNEQGWKDTAPMFPGEVTRVVARFDRPGNYVWHCHILSHEDHEMMRPYTIVDPSSATSLHLQSEGRKEKRAFRLSQNYPNPFNPVTRIHYALTNPGHIRLVVYDVLGREVAILVDEVQDAGEKSVAWDATNVPSGLYYYKLTAGTFSDTKKLVLIK